MSEVLINGRTYNNVEVHDGYNNSPRTLTFIIPKGNLDLDDIATDFSSKCNVIKIDNVDYTGYVVFGSFAYDLVNVVIVLSQKTMQEQLDDANAEIAELQDATAELIEMIGG